MESNSAETVMAPQELSLPTKSTHYFQVDAMKALMIALVIMDHAFTHDFLHQFGSSLWERISIPVLMIIMGFNMGLSFEKVQYSKLSELYSRKYFENKLKRYMIPYLFLYLVHGIMRIIVTLLEVAVNQPAFYDDFNLRYIGFTFFYGPGLWFIPVLFGSILVFPLIYHSFTKNPTSTVVGTLLIEILNMVVMVSMLFANDDPETPGMEFSVGFIFFLYSIFSLLSAVGIGLWLSKDHRIEAKRNKVLLILGFVSLFYIVVGYMIVGIGLMGDYSFLFFPYSALLFMVGMKNIPRYPQGKFSDLIRKISKSTYHILLVQILYYSIMYQFFLVMTDGNDSTLDVFDANPINYLWYYPVSLLITISLGIGWKELEDRFFKKVKVNDTYKKIYNVLIILAAIAFGAWLVGNVLFFVVNPPF